MKPLSKDFVAIIKWLSWSFALFLALAHWYLRNPVIAGGAKTLESIKIEPAILKKRVSFLASISPPRQYKNERSMLAAEAFVQDEFEQIGYSVIRQEVPAIDHTYHNLIARFGDPTAKNVIVVGAHYDVCDDQPGADDNASGVAGVLELARLFKEHSPKLSLPVEFVVYSLEEPPFFGSQAMGSAIHANALKKNGSSVRYMVSLEMIGYFSNKLFSQHFNIPLLYFIYPWVGNFIGIVGSPSDRALVRKFKTSMTSNSEIPVVSLNAPPTLPGVDYSDHRSYWAHGWSAIMITDTAFLRNRQYHESGDKPDQLNFEAMAEVIRGVYSAIVLSDRG